MKIIHLVSCFGLSAVFSVAVSHAAILAAPSSLQEGLVLYMGFDSDNKNAYDSYEEYSGSVTGGNSSTSGEGWNGTAGFNPSGSRPGGDLSGQDVKISNFTVSFHFKDWVSLPSGNNAFVDFLTSDNKKIQIEGLEDKIQLWSNSGLGWCGSWDPGSEDEWQTFTFTVGGGRANAYINGVNVFSADRVPGDSTITKFSLGQLTDGSGKASTSIDDFAIWNRALTADEVEFISKNPANQAIPEPASATLGLLALAGLMARRRRCA